jgi:2'-hydroxyisoflavone reductase
MKLLILGGTVFVGRHLVHAARERGHTVTLFNRGQHNADLFPDVEKLRGDRTTGEGLSVLDGRTFDAVVDTCGYVPRVVRMSAERLADHVGAYCFISSISVYADFATRGMDETAPVGRLDDPTVEEVTGATYGPLKALCEEMVEGLLPGRTLNVRPGLIVGPDDPTDRFTYWPHRIARGGEFLVPHSPAGVMTTFIDVRDLAEWTIRALEVGLTGVYNVNGLPMPLANVVDACIAESGSDAQPVEIDEPFLLDNGVAPWVGLPLWIPTTDDAAGMAYLSVEKACEAGLMYRPLRETVRDTLMWDAARSQEGAWKSTLSPEAERDVIAKWRARQ